MKQHKRLRAASRCAAIVISLLGITAPAFGEEVSGKVYLDNGAFTGKLRLPDGTEIDIKNGDYKIFVPAGDYLVTFIEENRKISRTTTIHSSTVPLYKDIYLTTQ